MRSLKKRVLKTFSKLAVLGGPELLKEVQMVFN